MKGRWPKEAYQELLAAQGTMLAASAVLSGAYSRLNSTWIQRLTDQVDALNPSFTADCFSLFTILRHSLRYKVSLPPMIPIFERLGSYRRSRATRHFASRAASRINLAAANNNSTVSLGRDRANLNNSSAVSLGRDRESLKPSPLGQASATPSRPDTPASDTGSTDTDDRVLLSSDKALWDAFNNIITWQTCHVSNPACAS